jgi:hypothetical protein
MWRVTPKGVKEAKNIFDIKKGVDLGFSKENVEKKEMGFEYFEDSVEIEVSQLGDSSMDHSRNAEESFEKVGLIRKLRRGKKEWLKSNNKQMRIQFKSF